MITIKFDATIVASVRYLALQTKYFGPFENHWAINHFNGWQVEYAQLLKFILASDTDLDYLGRVHIITYIKTSTTLGNKYYWNAPTKAQSSSLTGLNYPLHAFTHKDAVLIVERD